MSKLPEAIRQIVTGAIERRISHSFVEDDLKHAREEALYAVQKYKAAKERHSAAIKETDAVRQWLAQFDEPVALVEDVMNQAVTAINKSII